MENLVEIVIMLFEKWKLIFILFERVQSWTSEYKYYSRKNWFRNKICLIIDCLVLDINSCIDELNDLFKMNLPKITIIDPDNPYIPHSPSIYEVTKANVDTENLSMLASREEMQHAINVLQHSCGLYKAHTQAWIDFSDINYIIKAEEDLWDRFLVAFEETEEYNR